MNQLAHQVRKEQMTEGDGEAQKEAAERINVLLVEDDLNMRADFRAVIQQIPKLRLLAETGSETEAVTILRTGMVDAMILDLELEEGSGIHLISTLGEEMLRMPITVVITNVRSRTVYEVLRDGHVDFIYTKNNPQYGPLPVLDIILKCSRYLKGNEKSSSLQENADLEETGKRYTRDYLLWQSICTELKDMGFSRKGMGTTYLNEAIFYIIKHAGAKRINLTKDIYPMLAEKYGTPHTTVERNIRTAIETAWGHMPPDKLEKFYPFSYTSRTGRPTNMEFIFNMAELIGDR